MPLEASVPSRTRTPPDLKWLLNQRAAKAGQHLAVRQAIAFWERRVSQAKEGLAQVEEMLSATQRTQERLLRDLQALDIALAEMYPAIDPSSVPPVRAWASRYGERGALTEFLCERLRAVYPGSLTAAALTDAAQAYFGLCITTPKERRALRDTVREALCRMRRERGVVEQLNDRRPGAPAGHWLWKAPPTLPDLMAMAREGMHDSQTDGFIGEMDAQ